MPIQYIQFFSGLKTTLFLHQKTGLNSGLEQPVSSSIFH
uniref:Uncharacterized protein n=1 Tax=Arundo donax TaxID=35708 RepID=A0A0A9CSH7_ARUDO